MAKRQYSDEDKAAALAALDMNEGNVSKTARLLSIPPSVLRDWRDGRGVVPQVAEIRDVKKGELANKFKQLANDLLESITSNDILRLNAQQRVIAAATATDKWQLLEGQPTERTDGQQKIIIEYVNPDDTD